MTSSSKIAAFATKQKYSMAENFAEIIDLITTVEDIAVKERIEAGSARQLNSEDVRFWEIKEHFKSDFNIYCDKTGNEIEYICSDAIIQMLSTHNDKRVIELITNAKRNRIDPNWLFTDPKSLDALSETDPIGYFVYAASQVLRIYAPYWQGKEATDAGANDRWRADKAFLNKSLQMCNELELEIIETNELMRRYLTITQTLAAINRVKFTRPITDLAFLYNDIPAFRRALTASIESIIEYEYSEKKVKSHLSLADISDLNLRYKGHSNFRGQRTLRGMSGMDQILAIVGEFTPTMNVIKQMKVERAVEAKLQEQQKMYKPIKHEGGPIVLNIPETVKPTIKLSFAQILQQKVK